MVKKIFLIGLITVGFPKALHSSSLAPSLVNAIKGVNIANAVSSINPDSLIEPLTVIEMIVGLKIKDDSIVPTQYSEYLVLFTEY